jgi:energy-coupling factor transporter ATP-binding protein EcfA2
MGEISSKLAEQLWADILIHDDGIDGTGGSFANLIGPFGVGKSTLLMQAAQLTRHLDYGVTKTQFWQHPERYEVIPETVIMKGLSDDHWNTLIPKNYKNSFSNYGKPKYLTVHIHEDDEYRFYEVSRGTKRKINHEINIRTYQDGAQLHDNIRLEAINVVYEPTNYHLTPAILKKLNQYKLKSTAEKDELINAPPELFWFEFIENLCRQADGTHCSLILDEFHLIAPAYTQGDTFHMINWLAHQMIHMRKNNISLIASTHEENLLDYRIRDRIVRKVWFKGALPKTSMVKIQALRGLKDIGEAIIEERQIKFGKFSFDKIPEQPPLLKAVA